MKPLNLDNRPCSPISSNCVIWQGQDIPCINLCSGDSVSDVVYKLALELCTIMAELNVSNYDLSCLDLNACPPEDFQGLIQLLINKICSINGTTTVDVKSGGCPDCVVSVAPCFVQDGQTTMQLIDYVQMIANKVCSLINDITNIQNQINSLDTRVTILENTPPPTFTLPSIIVDCTLEDSIIVGGNSYPIDQILDALINDDIHGYCALKGATGEAAALLSAVASQCVDGTDASIAHPGQTMATAYFGSWVTTPTTVADTIENLWLSICDTRNGSGATIVTAGDGIDVTSVTVGSTTTYTVSTLGALRAQSTPTDLPIIAPDPGASPPIPPYPAINLYSGVKQIMSEIYDDDNAYDPITGIWTCPATGRYDMNFYVHLSHNPDGTTGFTSGMVIAGIVASDPTGYYTVSSMTVNRTVRHIDVTGSLLAINLAAGIQLQLNILNMSDYHYTPHAGDVARLSIQRVR